MVTSIKVQKDKYDKEIIGNITHKTAFMKEEFSITVSSWLIRIGLSSII